MVAVVLEGNGHIWEWKDRTWCGSELSRVSGKMLGFLVQAAKG